ncbi:heme-binding domain-containing protein [Arenibacter sp. GZD96]|uniref:heme-binding domain-containing protein n=1 Tax=Aurantibrevibacter litoralis TaxID=3106030 RepID=UPI002B000417|nr:heme-binding domain-containing protein [Arenibacter sp. GZD-96]MEA1785990.1 heme-binding domain-containing protein [Arenibacter sp. GZD-96]
MLKKIGIGLAVVFIGIQFIRPEKNLSNDRTYDIGQKYAVPEEVNAILKVSCNDCHSNKTEYPWYANIQPVAWWLNDHVVDGKRHLNFSSFTKLPIAVQNHKFEETIEMVEENEMPLPSYTNFGLHKEAKLTDAQRALVIEWAKAQMTHLKNTYPADSLVLKRRS